MTIDDREQARKLARAILADVDLYGGKAAGIEEGRALFRSHVDERLHQLFEDALAEVARSREPSRREASRDAGAREAATPAGRGGVFWPAVFVIGFVALVAAAILLWLSQRVPG